ncbi:MAG: large repetitive protein [Verrucomicrobiota bacterium]|jgi:hypothetical protein
MKKYLFPLIAGLGLAVNARSAVILSDTFTYADGALTSVSTIWTNHSGTVGQVDVTAGRVNISQAEGEDVNSGLAGAPYASGNLYASFIVNFSALPLGNGGYFAHFKDLGTANFKARITVTTTNVTAGFFRIGIANNGAAATFIAKDLSLNTDYLIVVRYNTAGGTAASTIWINPSSEGSAADRADASDANAAVPISTFALRQSTASGAGMGVLRLDDLKVGTAFSDVTAGGSSTLNPPFLSNIPNQYIPRDAASPAVPFYVTDGETANGSLTLSAVSSNPAVVPDAGVVFANTSGDSNRTVTVTPAGGQQGVSEITVQVTDGDNNSTTRKFLVIVGAPTISTFTNLVTPKDTATAAIPFTVGDAEGDSLTLSAASTNETVVPVSGIVFGGSGANRTITITPAAGANGLSRVTVFVSDGFNTASNSFVITVFPSFHVVLCDGFDYPDGVLTTVSSIWGSHSGTPGEVRVTGGKILISSTNTEDVSATFTNPPSFTAVSFLPSEGWILYSRFTVNFLVRPTGSGGDYFAHFRNSGTGSSFGGKVFAATNGAAPGKLRLGVSNSANAPANVVFPQDLDLGTTYTVVTRYNVGMGLTTLWLNPTSESSQSITASDGAFPFTTETYSFRESGGIGTMTIDDVKVSTSFSDLVSVAPSLTISAVGNNVTISWPSSASGYVLRYTDTLPLGWADFSDQGTVQGNVKVVTLSGVTGNRFFELQKP